MDFDDSPQEARIRARARAWLELNRERAAGVPRGEWAAFLDAEATPAQIAAAKRWERALYEGGWVGITWPTEYGGQGGTFLEQVVFSQELRRARLPLPFNAIGYAMAGPTILAHGTDSQKERYLRPILAADEIWCQLFSEPGAGSDLAALETRAVRDGDDFIVNGQKVWTSGAHYADMAILLARTNPEVPKHKGITYFVLDMHTPGITVRPLRQIGGGASFNEVFLEDVRVPAGNILGREDQGWAVAMTTLTFERLAAAGSVGEMDVNERSVFALARQRPIDGRPAIANTAIRQSLARLIAEVLASRYAGYRQLTRLSRGETPGPESVAGKLRTSDSRRHACELALEIEGLAGTLLEGSEYTVANGQWQREFLELPGWTIGGGADEVLKNIIAERVLAMPDEPRLDKGIPFKDLPRGTRR